MKKLLFIISFFICAQAMAQISWGVKGGYDQNSLILSNNTIENSTANGFHLGVFSELRIGPTLSLQPEVLYQTFGGRIAYPIDGQLDTVTHEIHALSIPALISMRFSAFSIDFGASYNYILDYRTRAKSGRRVEDNGWMAESDIKAILGVQLRLGRARLGVRASRNVSVFDQRSLPDINGMNRSTDVRLMSLQGSLGLSL